MSIVDWSALALVVVGALNWGLMGLAYVLDAFVAVNASWNLVAMLATAVSIPQLEFAIYLLVGLAAIWTAYLGSRIAGIGADEPVAEPARGTAK
jgi:uncharacterized membrane protein YuzA (DUF378 family)